MSENNPLAAAWSSLDKAQALLADAIEEGNGRKQEVALHHLLSSCVMLLQAVTDVYGQLPSAFPAARAEGQP